MNAIFIEGQKIEPYFHVRDHDSWQKLLPTTKNEAIAVISSTMIIKPTASEIHQPPRKYKVISAYLDKTVASLI